MAARNALLPSITNSRRRLATIPTDLAGSFVRILGTGDLLGRKRQDRLDGGPTGAFDQFIEGHLGSGDQIDHLQKELSLSTQEFREFTAIGLIGDLVRCRIHGYSFKL